MQDGHRQGKRRGLFLSAVESKHIRKCGGDGGTGNVFRQRNEKKIESAWGEGVNDGTKMDGKIRWKKQ